MGFKKDKKGNNYLYEVGDGDFRKPNEFMMDDYYMSDEYRDRMQKEDVFVQGQNATDTQAGFEAYLDHMNKLKAKGGNNGTGTVVSTEGHDTEEDYNTAVKSAMRKSYDGSLDGKKKSGSTMEDMFNEYLNSKYYANAVASAKNLAQNVLGQYSARTGGMGNSYAVQAAETAGTNALQGVEDELWNMSRNDFKEQTDKYTQIVDYMLSNGAKVEEIPPEILEKSGYNTDVAKFKEQTYSKANNNVDSSEDLTSMNNAWTSATKSLNDLYDSKLTELKNSGNENSAPVDVSKINDDYVAELVKICQSLYGKYSADSINKLLEEALISKGIDPKDYFD